jgi:hypothetical protein
LKVTDNDALHSCRVCDVPLQGCKVQRGRSFHFSCSKHNSSSCTLTHHTPDAIMTFHVRDHAVCETCNSIMLDSEMGHLINIRTLLNTIGETAFPCGVMRHIDSCVAYCIQDNKSRFA